MNALELCVWLNGYEGLSADLFRDIDVGLSEKDLLDALLEKKKITPHCSERLRTLCDQHWAEGEIDR
ncbi:MAG: hypothetical protein IJ822_09015, partial [Pyramidobacter sp.]|nr:hypothetical protein [Pyramidobacter sp.]